MATPFPFVSGAVLPASSLNAITTLPINDQTASYTLVVGDIGKRVIMNNAGATTITVDDAIFGVGDTIFIANKGAGVSTITAGAGVTINTSGSLALAQYGGGTLIALSASTFTFFPAGGVTTLEVEFLLVGGGGGGGSRNDVGGGGGGGGGFVTGTGIIGKDTYTVTVGAAGSGTAAGGNTQGRNGTASSFVSAGNGGGGGGANGSGGNGGSGGGGGGFLGTAGGAGISGEGSNGGTGFGTASFGGGGGGGKGGVGGNGSGSVGGAGGAASTNNFTGSSISYSGGGGGGIAAASGAGTGGTNAGNGGSNAAGGNGTANRGGGGGGAGSGASNAGGNGGSGQVVIRYLTADAAAFSISTTGTVTTGTDGSYTFHQYDSTGTLVVA